MNDARIHIISGPFYNPDLYFSITADTRAVGGFMLRNRTYEAIFGGTLEECMGEAAREAARLLR